MPKFAYTARDRSGQSVGATIEAPSRKDVVRLLNARGLNPVQIEEAGLGRPVAPKKAGGKAVPAANTDAAAASATRRLRRGAVKLGGAHQLPFLESLLDLTTSGLSAGEA